MKYILFSDTTLGRVLRSSILKTNQVLKFKSFKSLSVPKRSFSKFSNYNLQCCQRKTLVRRFQSKASPIPKQFPNKSSSESFVFVKYAGFSLGVSLKKVLFLCGITFEVLVKNNDFFLLKKKKLSLQYLSYYFNYFAI